MPRVARFVAEGVPRHVTQRGNARQQVLRCPDDYALYEDLLQEQRPSKPEWPCGPTASCSIAST